MSKTTNKFPLNPGLLIGDEVGLIFLLMVSIPAAVLALVSARRWPMKTEGA
jgi:hypothetical protein